MSTRVWLECSVKLGFFNYSLFSNCSSFSLLQGSNLQNIKTKISSPPIGHFVLIRGLTQMIRLPIGRRGGGTPRVLSWDSDHCLGTPRVLSWDSDHCLGTPRVLSWDSDHCIAYSILCSESADTTLIYLLKSTRIKIKM